MRSSPVRKRWLAAVAVGALIVTVGPSVPAAAAGGPNLAAGKPTAASSVNQTYVAGNLTDGNQATYWESANNAFPQWGQVDLGSSVAIDQVVLKLPTGWGTRSQTLSVQGSADGVSFATIVGSAPVVFDGAGNAATINFGSTTTRYVRVNITANTGWPAAQLSELEVYGTSTSTPNLAAGKAMAESSHADVYAAANANDGNLGTYWESANNAFPQWVQVDLGASVNINKVVAKLPTAWGSRNQTFAIQGSTTGSGFTDIVAAASYAFTAGSNTVTVNFTGATTRYVRLLFTANSGWPAGQLAELEVYGPGTGDTIAPTVPGTLSFTQSGTTITLAWGASTDTGGSGLAGYDIYRDGLLAASTSGTATTYADTQPTTATVSYYVRARDGAGNQSGNSNTVTRTATTPDTTPPTTPGTLSYTQSGTTITLAWGASTDTGGSGLAGYDIYRNGTLAVNTNGPATTYSDTQPANATVSYYVRARDGAGNVSGNSNTVTRTGTGNPPANLALGRTATATGSTFTFVPANAVDGNVTTYWEGSPAYPQELTVALGANAAVTTVVVKLNPDPAWGTRTQNFSILGRDQASSSYTQLKAAQDYTFTQGSNVVTIALTATTADIRLRFNSNTGAPSAQVAELEVWGTPAPNPDLTLTNVTWSPASPVETSAVTLSATVNNIGDLASTATTVNFYLGATLKGSAGVGAIAAGGSSTVNINAGTLDAATYTVSAKVDEANTVIERNDANNSASASTSLVVAPIQSADIVPVLAFTPSNPSAGNTVTFTVAIRNQGNIATSGAAHGITLTLLDGAGATVVTRTGSVSGAINAGATSAAASLGTWTAVNGRYTVRVALAADSAEQAVKQANNTADTAFFVGRGANMPYDMYEAEDGSIGNGATLVGPNRVIGDLGGEASGRRAVTLNGNGSYVQWVTKAPTNTLVTRFSIPDSAGGGGTSSSLSIYVNGTFHKSVPLTSRYAWLYGAESEPSNSPGSGGPRHIYDEASIMLDTTVPQGATIKLQRDAANGVATIDFVNLELVSPIANPDPARYVVPAGPSQQQVQAALDTARQDTSKLGVYLPAGTYTTSNKFVVYGRGIDVVGAGPWYTRFTTPQDQENTDAGFDVQASGSGSKFRNLSFFGNYTSRINGPGKVWGELKDVDNLTIDNTWVEHTVCAYWGVSVNGLRYTNSRIRDTFADGINMTSDSTAALVSNVDARGNGDDAFALFSAIDGGGSVGNHDNVFENLSATLTWRAAGLAVYGGYNNVFRNLYIADQLTYAGITISSLDFGYPFVGFGTVATQFSNITIARAGGHFWGNQVFPAIWCFSASKEFRGIRVSDVDIIDPTYGGVMFQTNYPNGYPGNPGFPVTDTVFTNITISGAQRSGDQYDAKSGWGIWANESAEANQGPAVGSVTFNHITFTNVFTNVKNTTSTFTVTINP